MNLPCYILCGGQSRRFGTDKARVPISGQPQLLHLATALEATGHPVHYVADRADRYSDLGLTCLVDQQPNSGPMAGLASALAHRASQVESSQVESGAGQGWLLLVSCDQAQWDESWYRELSAAKEASPGAAAAAYYDTAWQPLPALYHIGLLSDVNERLRASHLSLQTVLGDLDARQRCVRVTTELSPSTWSFNTPDELAGLSKR